MSYFREDNLFESTQITRMKVSKSQFGSGIAVGIGIGTALGVAMGNIPIGISIGIALGACIAIIRSEQAAKKED